MTSVRGDHSFDVDQLLCDRDVAFLLTEWSDLGDSLRLPFRTAVVADSATAEFSNIDWLVVGEPQFFEGWFRSKFPSLRPGTGIVVLLSVGIADATAESPQIERIWELPQGLFWRGFGVMQRRPCLVFSVVAAADDEAGPSGLAEAVGGFRTGLRYRDLQLSHELALRESTRRELEWAVGSRLESERALLDELDRLLDELDRVRSQHVGWRLIATVLGRHRFGRLLLRALRPVAGRLRRIRSRLAGKLAAMKARR